MPKPSVVRGSDHFSNVIYEGNGGGQRVGNFVPYTDNGTIAKSCIFDKASSGRMNRDFTSAGTNTKKCTLSFWFKLGTSTTASGNLISAWGGTGYLFQIFKYADNHGSYPSYLMFQHYDGGSYNSQIRPNRSFEDRSKFYHCMYVWDSTESTNSDRIKIYIDGDQITSFSTSSYPSQNADFVLTDKQSSDNTTVALGTNASQIGGTENQFYDGYLAEVNIVDGSALGPSTFGLTDSSTGRWIPKSLSGITYGSNGARLTFANTAGLTIGDDTSGNTNDFTISNIATTDITTDSPTQNHATLSHLRSAGSLNLTEGNLKITGTSGSAYGKAATDKEFPSDISTGLYWEYTDCANGFEGGVIKATKGKPQSSAGETDGIIIQRRGSGGGNTYWVQKNDSGSIYNDTGVSASDGQTIGVAVKSGKIWFAINNTWVLSGDPAAGTNPAGELDPADYFAMLSVYGTVNMTANFGQKSFQYTPPTGFVAYQQDNLPAADKDFADFVWIKNRDTTDAHAFYDSSRGPQKEWENSESNEATVTDGLQKFLNGGFSIEDNDALNTSGESFVSWCWHANGGTTTANTDGSGATVATTIQANDTAGFSICQFQGTGSTLKFAHGLSATPEWFITKRLDGSSAAVSVYHVTNGINEYLHLNETDAVVDSGAATSQFTGVSSTNITLGSNSNSNNNGSDVVAYVWRSVPGFSKFASYVGNGSTNGPYVHLGFSPAWLMIKRTSSTGGWFMWDTSRQTFNPNGTYHEAQRATAEDNQNSTVFIDFVSNGFKIRGSSSALNTSSSTYVYMAFAEHPFLGDGTNPVTAR